MHATRPTWVQQHQLTHKLWVCGRQAQRQNPAKRLAKQRDGLHTCCTHIISTTVL
jgi:hypothetical protein